MNIESENGRRKRSIEEETSADKRSRSSSKEFPSSNSLFGNSSHALQTGLTPYFKGTRDTYILGIRKRKNDDIIQDKRKKAMLEVGGGLSPFVYDTTKKEKIDNQIKYGPKWTLDKKDLGRLSEHFGGDVGERFTQYSSKRKDYVDAAEKANRSLTIQEHDVKAGRDPGSTSINHIIASGTGQNMLNRMTLQFLDGKQLTREENIKKATGAISKNANIFQAVEETNQRKGARKELLKGLAMQAAAVGRMTGVGREILKEETSDQGYGKRSNVPIGLPEKRNAMMKDVLNTFQGKNSTTSMNAYKSYMKNTFDSTGNLRLGHGGANGRVSTGFDMPLDAERRPTQRGLRLLDAHQSFAMPNMLDSSKKGAGIFTTTKNGQILSSSMEKKK